MNATSHRWSSPEFNAVGYVQVQVLNETLDMAEWDKGSITMPAP